MPADTFWALEGLHARVPEPGAVMIVGDVTLAAGRARWQEGVVTRDLPPVHVAAPVRGTWVALNSPGSRAPSHGIRAYGQTYAIDVLVPDRLEPAGVEHAAPAVGWGVGARPETFVSFGEPVHAVADGVVVAVAGGQRDHRARNSWPGFVFMLVEGSLRELGGPRFVLGNHVVVDHGDGVYAAYAHLRRRSPLVRRGDVVVAGQRLAEVGSSGNTSEPHLHVQLMDRPRLTEAAGLPWRWAGVELRADVVAPRYGLPKAGEGERGLPANGQVFDAADAPGPAAAPPPGSPAAAS